MKTLLLIPALLLIAGAAQASDEPVGGTDGTATSWYDGEVLTVEACDKNANGTWDYEGCVRVVVNRSPQLLCKRGGGVYKWALQVGSEESVLWYKTTCK